MAVAAALNVNVAANTAGFAAGMKKAKAETQGFEKSIAPLKSALATFGVSLGAVDFLKSSVDAYREAEQQQKKLAAVLEATGHAAGFTHDQLKAMNSALQAQTNFDDDAIARGEAVLATFKQIQGVQFSEAIGSMLDLSAVLGQDLQSSALQLGKALNDPVRGITALRRAGVSFTAEQEKQIKAMVGAGDVVSAQTIILDELKNEFGGAAKAMRDDLTGLSNDWGDLKESIGALFDNDVVKAGIAELAAAVRNLGAMANTAATGWKSLAAYIKGDAEYFTQNALKIQEAAQSGKAAAIDLAKQQNAIGLGFKLYDRLTAPGATASAKPAGRGAAIDAEGAATAAEHAEAIEKEIAALDREIKTFGMSAAQKKLAALETRELADAEREEIAAKLEQLDALERQAERIKAEEQARQRLAESFERERDALQMQIDSYGKSEREIGRMQDAYDGLSKAQSDYLDGLREQIETQKLADERQRDMDEATDRFEALAKDVATPAERLQDKLAEINKLRNKGFGGSQREKDILQRAEDKARAQYDEEIGANKKKGTFANPNAIEANSAEAYSTIFNAPGFGSPQSKEKVPLDQLREQRRARAELEKLNRRLAANKLAVAEVGP